MPRPASRHPTELELEILKVLWRGGAAAPGGAAAGASGRDVQAALRPFRPLAYTSVITILNIMTRKRYLSRRKVNGVFRYVPQVSERVTARGMLGDLVRRVFRGSRAAALLGLLEEGDLDERELELLRKLVEQKPTKD